MAYLTRTDYRIGEKGPLQTTATVEGDGTLTGVAAGSLFTLYGPTGQPMAGYTDLSISALGGVQIAGDGLSATVYINLDTAELTPNLYYGVFHYSPQTSDALARIVYLDVQVRVLPLVEMVATFDPLTARGKLRSLLRDTSDFEVPGTSIGITNAVFSDTEVDGFLHQVSTSVVPGGSYTTLSNQTLYMAAYYGWMRVAAEKATLVKVKKILFIQSNTKPTYDAAKDLAQEYLEMAGNESSAAFGSSTGLLTNAVGVSPDRCADEFGHVRYSGHRNPYY